MRLTADLISRAGTRYNPASEWELDLRGCRIPVLENLGATKDQYDAIDLSDNEIAKVDGMPVLRRVRSLYLANNRVARVAADIGRMLPNLETLVLTNNRVVALSVVDCLAGLKRLQHLSLLHNAVQRLQHYRLYVIHKLPSLKVLDFCRIKRSEREAAAKLFTSKTGKAVEAAVAKAAESAKAAAPEESDRGMPDYSEEQLAEIQKAVELATSEEEMDRIEKLVKTGRFFDSESGAGGAGDVDMEE